MAEVIFNKLEKVYSNGFKAVHGIDLKIADGEFMVIVGPSGCAKSTTLRMLAGLETISGGEVRIGDKIVNNLAPKSRGIAMVFQNYALYPHMTVRENLAFGLKLSKLPKAQIDRQVEEAAKILELEELLDRLPRQLSGGQAQRVAVGRAIVKKPDVFLFDEPLSNLDAKLRASMRIRISDLHKQLKKSGKPATTVYVTHDQTEALTLADKIGIMKDGSLIAHGETHELYHYPPNRFSAEFLGRANILQATALKDSPEPGLVSVSCGGSLINAFSRGGLHGNNKLLCIRPQHMSLAPRSATSNRLNATLTSVHWQGDLTHLLCDVAGEAVRIVMTQVNPLPRAGDKLALYFEPGDAVLIEVQ